MLVLVIVAIAALVIGALASGIITHAIGSIRTDVKLEVVRIEALFASITQHLHSRIDALSGGHPPPLPVADPVTAAEADEGPQDPAAGVDIQPAPATVPCPTCGATDTVQP